MTASNLSPRFRHPAARLALFLGVLLVGAMLLTGLLYLVHFPAQRSHGELQPWPLFATGILAFGLVTLTTWICHRLDRAGSFRSIGLGPDHAGRSLLQGIGLGAIVPAAAIAGLVISGNGILTPTPPTLEVLLSATLPMAAATLLLSSWEELAFRGYPLRQLSQWSGPLPGAIITGALFGLAHSGNPGADVLGFLNTAVNGALLAGIVLTTNSLWWACGYHAGWNLMASLVLGTVDSGTHAPGALLHTELSGPAWLSGGEYGFEASALTGVLELLLLGLIFSRARRRVRGTSTG